MMTAGRCRTLQRVLHPPPHDGHEGTIGSRREGVSRSHREGGFASDDPASHESEGLAVDDVASREAGLRTALHLVDVLLRCDTSIANHQRYTD